MHFCYATVRFRPDRSQFLTHYVGNEIQYVSTERLNQEWYEWRLRNLQALQRNLQNLVTIRKREEDEREVRRQDKEQP